MKLFLIPLGLLVLTQISYSQECSYPWQKVNDDICLFLTSITKTWDHAKFLCNFYGGDLLFIQNESEQNIIQTYLSKLLKYRFNRKPYIWLDATDQRQESHWLWSRNNKTMPYSNWIPSHHNSGVNSGSLNCGCYKPNNGFWKDCDCSLTQHFTCRKPPMDNFEKAERILSVGLVEESPNMAGFSSDTAIESQMLDEDVMESEKPTSRFIGEQLDNQNDEDLDKIMMDLILTPSRHSHESDLMSDENNVLQSTTTSSALINLGQKTNTNLKELQALINSRVNTLSARSKIPRNFLRPTRPISQQSLIMNLMKIRVNKSESSFSEFHCPQGFGYYMIEYSGCTKYKHCENWNKEYASLSVNKCRQGVFDFTRKMCVPNEEYKCDLDTPRFVPEA